MSWTIRRNLRRALRVLIRILQRAENALGTPELVAAEQHDLQRDAMTAHDMVAEPDEAYYRDRYLEWLLPELEASGALRGRILDAGCGPGRILVPIAQRASGHVDGVDYLAESIAGAGARVEAEGLANVTLIESDLLEFLKGCEAQSYDAAVFLEVAFVLPHLDSVVAELARVLKPGTVLLASFRTRTYLVQAGVATRDFGLAERAVGGPTSGALDGMGWQNFHDAAEAQGLLAAAGFEQATFHGVGAASGIAGDPLAALARPGELSGEEQRRLALVEDELARRRPDGGRYVCVRAVRGPKAAL